MVVMACWWLVMFKSSCEANTRAWTTPVLGGTSSLEQKNLTSYLKKLMLSSSTYIYIRWKALIESYIKANFYVHVRHTISHLSIWGGKFELVQYLCIFASNMYENNSSYNRIKYYIFIITYEVWVHRYAGHNSWICNATCLYPSS